MSKQLEQIEQNISSIFNIDIKNPTRKEVYTIARAVYYKIARDKTLLPYDTISKAVGKNHATAINGIKVFNKLDQYPEYLPVVNRCLKVYQMPLIGEAVLENTFALQQQVTALKNRVKELSNDVHPLLLDINALPEDKLSEFVKYRVEPFLKMNR